MTQLATDELNAACGHRLATVRGMTGLSQAAFAASLGVSLRAYINYENGEREAPTAVLRSLYQVHRINPVWILIGGSETPTTVPAKPDAVWLHKTKRRRAVKASTPAPIGGGEPRSSQERHEQIKMRLRVAGSSLADIARELSVNPTTVTQVSKGRATSRRIQERIATTLKTVPAKLWPELSKR